MIVLDIETSGLSPTQHSLLSIGAVDYDTNEEFYGECHMDPHREVTKMAMKINGFTEDQIWDIKKLTTFHLYQKFLDWSVGRHRLLAGQQVGAFDIKFLEDIATNTQGVDFSEPWPFGYRSVDLHSIAYDRLGESLSLDGILKAVGLDPEPKPHNALTGARLEAEAFRRLRNRQS